VAAQQPRQAVLADRGEGVLQHKVQVDWVLSAKATMEAVTLMRPEITVALVAVALVALASMQIHLLP
jgi:hypothetical protein